MLKTELKRPCAIIGLSIDQSINQSIKTHLYSAVMSRTNQRCTLAIFQPHACVGHSVREI